MNPRVLVAARAPDNARGERVGLDEEAVIQIHRLKKTLSTSHGSVAALDGIDLSILRGEFVCVVGPSGCGKTTLLNIVAGLATATSGTVELAPAAKGHPQTSVVFQEQRIFPWMTVLDNAAFGLMARRVPNSDRERIAHGFLARIGSARFSSAYPASSQGA